MSREPERGGAPLSRVIAAALLGLLMVLLAVFLVTRKDPTSPFADAAGAPEAQR